VAFDQSINLVNRLKEKGVPYETLVIPDDTHEWLIFHHLLKIYNTTVDFLERKVRDKR
jgi:dipeptidyl aminopeptidase/acylaminoacyl peptidase